jgi:hypothetical protein
MSILDILIDATATYAAIASDPAEEAAAYSVDVEIAYRDAIAAGIDPDEVAAAWNTGYDLGTIPA